MISIDPGLGMLIWRQHVTKAESFLKQANMHQRQAQRIPQSSPVQTACIDAFVGPVPSEGTFREGKFHLSDQLVIALVDAIRQDGVVNKAESTLGALLLKDSEIELQDAGRNALRALVPEKSMAWTRKLAPELLAQINTDPKAQFSGILRASLTEVEAQQLAKKLKVSISVSAVPYFTFRNATIEQIEALAKSRKVHEMGT